MKCILLATALLGLTLSAPAEAAVYKVDVDHSTVEFKVKHLLSPVRGLFNKFEGTIEYEPGKPESWKTQGTIEVSSIDTRNEKRDEHLRGADFFDAANFATIEFRSTGVEPGATDESAKLNGVLKMHGVEKPITLDVKIHGVAKDPWGNTLAGFSATVKLNRKDFGINWNKALDNGGVLVGEEVEVTIDVEAALAAEPTDSGVSQTGAK